MDILLKRNKINFIISLIIMAFLAVFAGTASYAKPYSPTEYALAALVSDEDVTVTKKGNILTFSPAEKESENAFVFYPGAFVDYRAYSPVMHGLAEEGVTCYLVHMPFNFALAGMNRASAVRHEEGVNYYIGGHSLGGVCAAYYLADHVNDFKGYIAFASYSTKDFSGTDLKCLSIRGSNDQVLNMEEYTASYGNLHDPKEVVIEGGIHSYFGSYGHQKGDGEATITNEEQVSQIVSSIIGFMNE